MLITITDFAKERNVDRDTVNAYLNNHAEIKNYTKLVGKNRVIDTNTDAYKMLDKKYPLPKLVQVVEDTESKQKLAEKQEELARALKDNADLQAKLGRAMTQVAQLATIKQLLEDKTKELANKQNELTMAQESLHSKDIELVKANTDRDILKAEIDRIKTDTEEKIKELQSELEIEKDKKWYHKLFGR